MRILENINVDFWGRRKVGFVISATLIAIALVSLVYPGLEAGIDFRGGTEFVVETAQPLDQPAVRSAMDGAFDGGVEVKQYGGPEQLLIRTVQGGDPEALSSTLTGTLESAFAGSDAQVLRIDSVGPRFADDLKRGAMLAVIGSLLVILLYIFIRFDWRYAVAAVLTLAHDVTIVLGLFALFHTIMPFSLQMDQVIIAALLTIVGYSINDTVVVFDRIREFANLFKTERFETVVNRGINSTLSRTVLTSVTTMLTVFVLFVAGGEVLRGFAFALLIGIAIGTYSSIFVASPIVIMLRERFPIHRKATSFAASR